MLSYTFTDEQTMLQHFVDFLDEIDPDVMLAWGLGFYDMPTLYRRLESVGIGAKSLSPKMLGKNQWLTGLTSKERNTGQSISRSEVAL